MGLSLQNRDGWNVCDPPKGERGEEVEGRRGVQLLVAKQAHSVYTNLDFFVCYHRSTTSDNMRVVMSKYSWCYHGLQNTPQSQAIVYTTFSRNIYSIQFIVLLKV